MKNKKGWIRIVEAFISLLLITGVLLMVIDKGYILKKDISSQIYKVELSILREIQLNDSLRNDILNTNVPIGWNNANFPQEVKNKIIEKKPDYLECSAKICSMNSICEMDEFIEKDIYAQPVGISANLETYDPRQLKLFCWVN